VTYGATSPTHPERTLRTKKEKKKTTPKVGEGEPSFHCNGTEMKKNNSVDGRT
jgi:hypothetical protein